MVEDVEEEEGGVVSTMVMRKSRGKTTNLEKVGNLD